MIRWNHPCVFWCGFYLKNSMFNFNQISWKITWHNCDHALQVYILYFIKSVSKFQKSSNFAHPCGRCWKTARAVSKLCFGWFSSNGLHNVSHYIAIFHQMFYYRWIGGISCLWNYAISFEIGQAELICQLIFWNHCIKLWVADFAPLLLQIR